MQHNRKRNALTILLVPRYRGAPVSLRLPVWAVPLVVALLVTVTVAAGVFGYRYYALQRHMNGLLAEQAIDRARQREMRATILSQQDEVRSLSTQVEGFKAELLNVRRLSDEIRDILGLTEPAEPTPVPAAETPSPSPSSDESLQENEVPAGRHVTLRPSARSMRTASDRGRELVGMRSEVPGDVQALQELRELVLDRVARVSGGDQTNAEALQSELRQWAMAPHLWPAHPHPISSDFGPRILRGAYNYHYGIDLAVDIGTPVRAARDGTVTMAGWDDSYGWVVEIAHAAGYSTLYGHNSSLLVRVGNKVKAGDVIALSGSSGNSTGPHVHYEIRLYGTPVDPLRYIDEG